MRLSKEHPIMRLSSVLLLLCLSASAGIVGAADRSAANRDTTSSCRDCGTVARIEPAARRQRGNAVMHAVGNALGDVALGHIDSDVATVAGAARDAASDDDDDRDDERARGYEITVRMDDGRRVLLQQDERSDRLREGDRVRVRGGRLSPIR
jgi:outer membrane lipoprotein SlyB